MMKDKVSSTKLKGTVLFTVVSVLMVLIVFLMGTLVLAATASNRAHTNYQKEQTEYTARAVLDTVVQSINADTSTNGIKYQMASTLTSSASTPLAVTVQASDGLQATVHIANAGTKEVYSETQEAWVSGTIYELSTTIRKNMADTTYCAYIVDEKIVNSGSGGGGGGAFVSLGGVGGKIGTGGFIAGGTEIGLDNDPSLPLPTYDFDNTSYQMVPVYINGNLNLRSQTTVYFDKVSDFGKNSQQFFAVTGDLLLNNTFDFKVDPNFSWPDGAAVDYTEVPCLYVGGTLKQETSDMYFNTNITTDMPINIYCGSVETRVANVFSIRGDIYAFDQNKTSVIQNQNRGTALYKWTKNNVLPNAPEDGFGNLFSRGSARIGGPNIEGSVRVEKDLTIQAYSTDNAGNKNHFNGLTYELNEDVVAGGKLVIDADSAQNFTLHVKGNIYADELVLNHTYGDPNGSVLTINCDGVIDVNTITTTGTAPCLISSDSINCTNYNGDDPSLNFFRKDGTSYKDDGSGNAIPAVFPAPGTADVAEKAGLRAEGIYPQMLTDGEIKRNIVTVPSSDTYHQYPSTIAEFEATMGSLAAIPTYRVGAGPGEEELPNVITQSCRIAGSVNKDITLRPTNTMLVVIDTMKLENDKTIYIDDTHGDVYFFITGNFDMGARARVVTEDYHQILENSKNGGGPITIEQVQPNEQSPEYPRVYIFADDDASLKVESGASVITAHVRAPGLKFKMDNCGRGYNLIYQQEAAKEYNPTTGGYDTVYTEYDFGAGNQPLGVIGQLICGNIDVVNEWGMIYVTLPTSGCSCCALCTGLSTCDCQTNGCTCASCTCGGGGGGGSVVIPDKFATMYYNYY